jgi:glutamate carboxypeptidase
VQSKVALDELQRRVPAMVTHLADLVSVESPSSEPAAVGACADALDAVGRELVGVGAERIVIDGHVHLRWRFGGGSRVVLIGHFDTVWPLGTLAEWPFTVDNGVARGPGAFDMKSGIVQAFHALSVLDDLDGIAVLITSDEELGSLSSRELIEDTARGAAAALVLEPSAGVDGSLKVARKGTSMYEVHIEGRAAHAGLEPEKGANALIELAHQVLAVSAFNSPAVGTTVTPTVASSGTATNVVPDRAVLHVDVRATSIAEQNRIDTELHALAGTASVAGTVVTVVGSPNRPPMEEASAAPLFARARDLGAALGLAPFGGIAVGGGSDGNFTAALGVPTLDGLGGVGGGAHGRDEHVVLRYMPERAALVAAMIDDIRTR